MSEETNVKRSKSALSMGVVFGIIMIIVYVGMGIAVLCGVFDWLVGQWAWLRWTAGIVLIVYGLFRAWRQIKGVGAYEK